MNSERAVVQLDSLAALPCPCGEARRAFREYPGAVASVHLVEIRDEAKLHFHRKTTELYVVLEGEGEIELDGIRHRVGPLSAIYIAPGVRHRALGCMRVINVPIPVFDPADEWVETGPGSGEFWAAMGGEGGADERPRA